VLIAWASYYTQIAFECVIHTDDDIRQRQTAKQARPGGMCIHIYMHILACVDHVREGPLVCREWWRGRVNAAQETRKTRQNGARGEDTHSQRGTQGKGILSVRMTEKRPRHCINVRQTGRGEVVCKKQISFRLDSEGHTAPTQSHLRLDRSRP